jgi:hypothetical protein
MNAMVTFGKMATTSPSRLFRNCSSLLWSVVILISNRCTLYFIFFESFRRFRPTNGPMDMANRFAIHRKISITAGFINPINPGFKGMTAAQPIRPRSIPVSEPQAGGQKTNTDPVYRGCSAETTYWGSNLHLSSIPLHDDRFALPPYRKPPQRLPDPSPPPRAEEKPVKLTSQPTQTLSSQK